MNEGSDGCVHCLRSMHSFNFVTWEKQNEHASKCSYFQSKPHKISEIPSCTFKYFQKTSQDLCDEMSETQYEQNVVQGKYTTLTVVPMVLWMRSKFSCNQ